MHYSTPNTNNSEDHLRTSAHTTTHPDAYHSTNTTARPCLFEGCGGVRTQVRMQYELHFTVLKLWYDSARDYLPFKNRKHIPLHQPVSPARCGFNPIMSGAYGPCCRSFLAAPRCQDADDVPASL